MVRKEAGEGVVGGGGGGDNGIIGAIGAFSFLFYFSRLFFISYERIDCPGWGERFHPTSFDNVLLFLSLLLSFLTPFLVLVSAEAKVVGVGF